MCQRYDADDGQEGHHGEDEVHAGVAHDQDDLVDAQRGAVELLADREALQPAAVVPAAHDGDPVLEVGVRHAPAARGEVDHHLVAGLVADGRELAGDQVDAHRDAADGLDVHPVRVVPADVAAEDLAHAQADDPDARPEPDLLLREVGGQSLLDERG